MTERGFHPFAVLHFLRKTILLYLLPLLQVLFARNWAALRTALVQGAAQGAESRPPEPEIPLARQAADKIPG